MLGKSSIASKMECSRGTGRCTTMSWDGYYVSMPTLLVLIAPLSMPYHAHAVPALRECSHLHVSHL